MRTAAVVFCSLLLASASDAQVQYVDHRSYPADFSIVQPGNAVSDRPGYVWRHDGRGWYHELATAPTPDPPSPPSPPPPSSCPKIISNYYVLLTCAERPPLPVNPWTKGSFQFEVGQLYESPYPSEKRFLVLSVSLDVDSLRRIVTGRKLVNGEPVGPPITFFEDTGGGWVPLRPQD